MKTGPHTIKTMHAAIALYVDGYSYQAVADMTGVPKGTVWKWVTQAGLGRSRKEGWRVYLERAA